MLKQPCDKAAILAAPPAPETATVSRAGGRWILAATILGSSMVFIDGTVVNVALPTLQSALHATAGDAQWIVESYTLFLAALLLIGGSLGDRFGRRLVFAVGVVVFVLASVWCGLAPSVGQLILARAVQGVGGALLTPGSLAIISAAFPPEERGQAIGAWSGFTAITAAAGPLLGGWLIQHMGWRWIFFLNVPLALIVLGLVFLHVPESRDEGAAQGLDGPGAALATLGLGGLVYGLIALPTVGIADPRVAGSLAVGIVCGIAFLFVEARSRAPMMPLALFRSRTFAGANLLTLLLYGGLSVVLYYVPFDLIQVHHYTSTAAGAALVPFVLILFFFSHWAGGLVNRYGAKAPLVVGPLVSSVGLALFALPGTGGVYWTNFFPAILVLGIGMAVSVAPLTTVVMGAVPTRNAGVASGINNAISRAAGLLAIACVGAIFSVSFNRALDSRLDALKVAPDVHRALDAQRAKLAEAAPPPGLRPEEQAAIRRAIAEAFVSGFRVSVAVATVLALAGALVAAWTIENEGNR